MASNPANSPDGTRRAGVLLPLPLSGVYDYRVPDFMDLAPGDFVRAPLGRRTLVGVVWGPASGEVSESRLRDVTARLAAPPLPEPTRRFVDWVAGYTLSPPGAVLKMAMSVPSALEPEVHRLAYVTAAELPPELRLTPARRRVLDVLAGAASLTAPDLARAAGVGPAVILGLARAGALEAVPLKPSSWAAADWCRPGVVLSPAQAGAAAALRTACGGGFSVALVDGVPGSGKTEVYFEAIAATLERGRQVLVLLPEIALGAQWLKRFEARFGMMPAEWHSDLTPARRRETWRAVAEGRVDLVVGARSALFLPFPDLGLIVVDEEHDGAFKQEEVVIYNARDMAVVRARLGGFPVVLVSGTPSLETLVNVERGRYSLLHLPDRHANACLPAIEVLDMRSHGPARGRWLSPLLTSGIERALAAGEQAMLFLNRRGYAPLTLCRACGHRLKCPHCTAWLVEHRGGGRLQCHHCGHAVSRPGRCPACAAEGSFVACGPGVERVAEEAVALFPQARSAIAASDTLTGPAAAHDLVRRIEEHEVDLVIGTQIVAKGYHFPLLTVVGVVDADLGLAGGDLRAAERTYQLLYQVAGRAGRAERPGRVLLQTYMPEHPVMAALASGDRQRFIKREREARESSRMPPFGRLVALIVSARSEEMADHAARDLARAAPRAQGIQVLGPAPAPLALLRGRHRRRLLLKAERDIAVQPVVRRWLAAVPLPDAVRLQVDVDPYSFL